MELAATQVYDEDEIILTQRVSHLLEEEELIQVGILSIKSVEYPIKKGITKVGRLSSCNIVLNDATVSKVHAEIEAGVGQKATWICDLNSSNKTRVNNLTLRPARSYELKDGSLIEFGKVRAIYRAYRSTDDTVIPETPVALQQKVVKIMIPNTPDSSFNNSANTDNDGSIIHGAQSNPTFRQPLIPHLCKSACIDKINTSATLHMSDNDNNENQSVSIYDMETQVYEGGTNVATSSIHDIETQEFSVNSSKDLRSNDECSKVSKINDYNDINKLKTHKDETSTRNLIVTNIHDLKTVDQVDRNIHDLETQKIVKNHISEDISNVESRHELNDIANKISNNRLDSGNDKGNISDIVKTFDASYENIKKSPTSRSSSPGSLNLSSPGVDEQPSSPLNQSVHLLESSDLLEYFGDGIDKEKEIRPSNASTPKLHSENRSKKINKIESMSDISDDTDEDDNIFDALTQRDNNKSASLTDDLEVDGKEICVRDKVSANKCGMFQINEIGDDSETDAEEYLEELIEKSSNKSCNKSVEDKNDPCTSIESEDMFNQPTQLNDCTVNKSANSSTKQLSKFNKSTVIIDGMTSMQTKNNTRDIHNQSKEPNLTISEVDDMALTQCLSSHDVSSKTALDHKSFSMKSDLHYIDDTSATQIINTNIVTRSSVNCDMSENLDSEDINYEMAPTQVIGDVEDEKERNAALNNSDHGENSKNCKRKFNDTLEQNLNEMFDNVNNDIIHETTQISTQHLEDILKSSQCDNDSTTTMSSVGNVILTDNISRMQAMKQKVTSSTITTRQRKNVLKDMQKVNNSAKDIILPHRQDHFLQTIERNNEKTDSNNKIITRSNRRGKQASKLEDQCYTMMREAYNNVSKAILNEKIEGNLQRTKRTNKNGSNTIEQATEKNIDKAKVDDVESHAINDLNIYNTPCSLEDGHRQTSNAFYDSDEDILTRLPAVRISGTFSNQPSPSKSSSSTTSDIGSKQSKNRKSTSLIGQTLCKRNSQESEKDKIHNQINNEALSRLSVSHSLKSSSVTLMADGRTSAVVNLSEDSDNETNYRRFKQMADRMLNNELSYLRKRNDENAQDTLEASDKEKNTLQTKSRVTRSSNKRNNEDTCTSQMAKNAIDRSKKRETKSVTVNKKRSSSMIEKEYVEQTSSKRHKADPVIEESLTLTRGHRSKTKSVSAGRTSTTIEYSEKTHSRRSIVTDNNKFIEEEGGKIKIPSVKLYKISTNAIASKNVASEITVRRIGRKINDPRVVISNNNIVTNSNQMQTKSVQAFSSTVRDASQEVEMIMKATLSNKRKANASIADKSLLEKEHGKSRLRSAKRPSINIEANSTSINMDILSNTCHSNDTQVDDSAPKAKRRKPTKNTSPILPANQIEEKKKVFRGPAPIHQVSSNLISNVSIENSFSEDNSKDSDDRKIASSRSGRPRTKAVDVTKENVEVHRNTRRNKTMDSNNSSSIDTSIENMSLVSTSSRLRRGVSLSTSRNSSPSSFRHKILFTGITEDKYSKVIKTLGGSKVENPAKCTILVTDKVRRTYKFLCALARGLPIVTTDWLIDSESAARFLEWDNYILKDPVAEAKFGFRLRKSLDKAKEKKLLDGYTILLTSGVAPPPIDELKDMAMSCGGKVLLRPPIKWSEKMVVVSREEDLSNAKRFVAKAPKTITVQSTEFILTGILRQEMDFVKYKLM